MTVSQNTNALNRGQQQLKQRIDWLCGKHGSLRTVARVLDIDHGYLSRLRSGDKDEPSDEVLRKLGLVKHVEYWPGKIR